MAIMRPITEMRDQMERLFHEMEEFQFPSLAEFRERHPRNWMPSVDLSETGGNYEIRMEVPGIKPENLDIQILEDSVIIRGQTREEKVEEKKDVYRRECHYGSLYRRVPLPGTVKTEGAKAELKNGILDLILPKAEGKSTKRIPVQAK
jgi:HSP20 family protein